MNSNVSLENKYSFIDLIKEFKIQIPILQRDYVQGRNTESVKEIRDNFVEDLVEHVSVETDKILPLDFIYGYADEEFGKYDREISKNNIESLLETIKNYSLKENFKLSYAVSDQKNIVKNLFIPLDGQQRLTTLFLLHFYVALKVRPERLSILKEKLTYKTRKSSDKFCQELLQHATMLSHSLPIAKAIQDSTWFLIGWKKDPTIEGVLVMLQTIEDKYFSYSDRTGRLNCAFQNLFENPKIYFDFLDMNEQGLTDDIYLKMNSTGKELSEYDNFKSWFVSKVEILLEENNSYKEKKYFENWKEKLDQEWYNLFWLIDPIQADKLFFNFIKSILSYSLINLDEEEKIIKGKFEKLNSNSFLPLKFFEENRLISIDNIGILFCVLDELSNEESPIINTISEIWSSTFSNGKRFKESLLTELLDLSLPHKLYFLSCFLLMTYRADLELSVFRKWIRVFRNIIYNTRVDDFSRFDTPVKVLYKFIIQNDELVLNDERWIDFFDGKQVREEFEKFTYENEKSISHFEELENHFYLYGQIFFLIEWSKDDKNEFDLDLFKTYVDRFLDLFSESHLCSNEFILQRALLIMNDKWMLDKGSNRYSFCKNTYNTARERDENWRILFNKTDSEILTLLKSNICKTEHLLNYILSKQTNITDWRKYILEDPSLIAKCGQRLINWGGDGNFIRLLDKTKLNGYHTELRTWVLYKQLIKEFNLTDNILYQRVEAGEKDCRILLVDFGVYILFHRVEKQFCYEMYNYETKNYERMSSYSHLNPDIIHFINNFNLRLIP